MPDYVGLIKYPVATDVYNSSYGEPQWWHDLAVTARAEAKYAASPKAIPAGAATTTLEPDTYIVDDPTGIVGLPPGAGPGVLEVTGPADTYVETGNIATVWLRRKISGLFQQWMKVSSEIIVPQALTRPMAESLEVVTSRSIRIPFQIPVRPRRWRVVIRNANYRTNTLYPGQVTLNTVAFGGGARDENGNRTSSFAPTKAFPNGLKLLTRDAFVEDMADGWGSGWATDDLVPGQDYMLSVGYQTNGQNIHIGMAGGWQTIGKPTNAGLINDATAAPAIRLPFDIRIEYTADDTTPQDVLIGDSISAGSNATFPVLEAPLAIADRSMSRSTRLYGFGGAAFGEWLGSNWGDPASMKWQDVTVYGRADRAVIALGNNDIHAGTDLTTLKARLQSMLVLVRERISTTVVVCTITPRTAWTGTSKEALRVAFNDWLKSLPEGITTVADTARAVEDQTGHAPRPDMVVSDGIHFNTAGSTALATAIANPSQDVGDPLTAYLNARGV